MTDNLTPNISAKKSLALEVMPDGTFNHDLEVSDRYQSYSAEILRLALLGIAGIGFLVINILLKDSSKGASLTNITSPSFRKFLSLSLCCLGLSAACALLHRFLSTRSLSRHLLCLRLDVHGAHDDDFTAKKKQTRNRLFLIAEVVLASSGVLLGLGAVFLALAFIFGIMYV